VEERPKLGRILRGELKERARIGTGISVARESSREIDEATTLTTRNKIRNNIEEKEIFRC
jgi:hypothetical protein